MKIRVKKREMPFAPESFLAGFWEKDGYGVEQGFKNHFATALQRVEIDFRRAAA